MRSQEELKDLIVMLLVEEINKVGFKRMEEEPENVLPKFVDDLSNRIVEVILDEIAFGRRR